MQRRQCIVLQISPWFLPYLVFLTFFSRTCIYSHSMLLYSLFLSLFTKVLQFLSLATLFGRNYSYNWKDFQSFIQCLFGIHSIHSCISSSIFLFKFYNRSHIPFDMEWILDGWFFYWIGWRCPLPLFPLCTPIYKPCHRLYIIDKRLVPCFAQPSWWIVEEWSYKLCAL